MRCKYMIYIDNISASGAYHPRFGKNPPVFPLLFPRSGLLMGAVVMTEGANMRTVLGVLVFIIGVGALGFWAREDIAVRIENTVKEDLAAADLGVTDAITFDVSGRDITVSGRVESEAARDALLAQLAEVPSLRQVHDTLELDK